MQTNFDTIIIGGGAAGIMAAISAKRHFPNESVAILDRTFALGRKILVCGAGRCNVTNINLNQDGHNHYYGADPDFVQSILQQFDYQSIVNFFANLGVELYVERKTTVGKLFPVTDQAKTITAVLEDELNRLGVKIFLNTEVGAILHQEGQFNISANDISTGKHSPLPTFNSKYLILSAGGKTYPALGSNGSGYDLAQSLGHNIIQPVPSALPLESKNQLSHLLQGTKLELEVTSVINDVEIKSSTDDVMFTQYGFSGPAVLNISREISVELNRYQRQNSILKLNFLPGDTAETAKTKLIERWAKRPWLTVAHSLYGLFPNKVADALVQISNINQETLCSKLARAEIDVLVGNLCNYRSPIHATRGWNEAEFTAGGIDTTEINATNLQSKVIPELYACGEILNVDGDVGGFNLSWAWSSGWVAGQLTTHNSPA